VQHRLSDISQSEMKAICRVCGPVKIKKKYKFTKSGDMTYRCREKWKQLEKTRPGKVKRPYKKHKKSFCETCGFVPQYSGQLDVDHIDGNNKNNSIGNLQTLCANCHRLKTYLNKDYLKQK